jgi:uncharacterized protein (DUF1697 family)
MATWIALLRGINVLGRNQVSMPALSAALERDGFARVRTYIQSGNVVFDCPGGSRAALAQRIARAVSDGHGFLPRVVVLSAGDLERAALGNPFPAAQVLPKSLHLYFLAAPARAADLERLHRVRSASEAFALRGRVLYLHTPEGFAASKVRNRIERALGVEATARNWRTVTQLIALARGGAG